MPTPAASNEPTDDDALTRVRAETADAPDGTVWLVHLDAGGRACLHSRLPEPVEVFDLLYVRDIDATVRALGLPGLLVAVSRRDGRPRRVDRRLARELDRQLQGGPCRLQGVVVIGADGDRGLVTGAGGAAGRALSAPRPAPR